MRPVTLFIAMSLDGYIADAAGGVDWLAGEADSTESDALYNSFVTEIDTVILGANTYRQIVTELSVGEWVYADMTTYVLTHKPSADTSCIRFTDESVCALIRRLQTSCGKGIWICGGASVVRQCMEAEIIDRYCITVIPTILGDGIRLFSDGIPKQLLHLDKIHTQKGMATLFYTRR